MSNSLKGRSAWNKGKKGMQEAWNKKFLPEDEIISKYSGDGIFSTHLAKEYNVCKTVILRILKENNIKIKRYSDFSIGKNYDKIYGKNRSLIIKNKLSESLKNQPVKNWSDKISKGLKKHHKNLNLKGMKIKRNRKPLSKDQRLKLSLAHKNYLKNNPQELERLKKIQFPGGITSIENRMLEFLKKYFEEGKDFYFDEQDMTNKTFYRPDFQFPEHKIIIELDGYYKHFTKEGYQKDKIRSYYLRKAGWKIYRFNFYDINRDYKFNMVKEEIKNIFGL